MTNNTITQSLSERYRPTTIDDLVLAPITAERLIPFRLWLNDPKPTAWLLHGETGLGKTSLARIAIRHFQAKYRAHVIEEAGPRVRDEIVEDWGRTFVGQRWFTAEPTLIVIDEADAMTKKAMFGLRTVIEGGYLNNVHWIMTSNKPPGHFGRALKSRLKPISYCDQALAPRMADHLMRISALEGYPLNDKDAMALVRRSGNDIRAALNELESLITSSRFQSVQESAISAPRAAF